jgi:hypothetical protein
VYGGRWLGDEEGPEKTPESDAPRWSDGADDVDWDGEVDVDVSDAAMIALIVEHLGTENAIDFVQSLDAYPRGSPEWGPLLGSLRALQRAGVLTADAHFFIVSSVLEQAIFHSLDDDPETMAMLDRIRAMTSSEAADDSLPWEEDKRSLELQALDAEWYYRCHVAWIAWIRELEEYEIALLAEVDPGTYERRRIAGQNQVYGFTVTSLSHCPENDGINGYRDPRC